VLSTVTIINRIVYTYQQTRILDAKAAEEAAAAKKQEKLAAPESNQPPAQQKPQHVPVV